MLDEAEKKVIERGMMTLWLIWGAIFISLFIYVFIAHALGEGIRQTPMNESDLSLLRNILIVVGIFEIFIIHMLRRFMLPKGPEEYGVENRERAAHPEASSFLSLYTKATIITLALAESIGIYGLVLFFLGDSLQTLYLFMAASAVIMFYFRPKKHELESLMGNGPYIT